MSKELREIASDDSFSDLNTFYCRKGSVTTFYNPTQKLHTSSSLNTLTNYEQSSLRSLQDENALLRKEIFKLKGELRKGCLEKRGPSFLQKENERLRRVIQKGFYSIRNLQKENESIKENEKMIKEKYQKAQAKIGELEKIRQDLVYSFNLTKENHELEVKAIWDRVSQLQKNIQVVFQMVEEDQRQWKKWKDAQRRPSKLYNHWKEGSLRQNRSAVTSLRPWM